METELEIKIRARAAAIKARDRYPGPVGEFLYDELIGVIEFVPLYGAGQKTRTLIDYLNQEGE